MDAPTLESFGFQENEAKAYLALLKYGALSPYELAEKTGMNRSYLYDLLNRMMEKGYVSTVKIKNKHNYQATPPRLLQKLFALRAEEFGKLVPQLETIRQPPGETEVELHKGKDAYKTLIKDILSTITDGDTLHLIVPDERAFETLEPIILQQYFRQLRERNVKEYVLTKEGGYTFKQANTTYRQLPETIIGNTSTFIYGKKVAEIILGTPLYLIIIKNPFLAETKRQLFTHLWKQAKKSTREL